MTPLPCLKNKIRENIFRKNNQSISVKFIIIIIIISLKYNAKNNEKKGSKRFRKEHEL